MSDKLKTIKNNADGYLYSDFKIEQLFNWTFDSDYIVQTGFMTVFKISNRLAIVSLNFQLKTAVNTNVKLISGLPRCKTSRFLTSVVGGGNNLGKLFIDNQGNLYSDGNMNATWYNGIIIYPID